MTKSPSALSTPSFPLRQIYVGEQGASTYDTSLNFEVVSNAMVAPLTQMVGGAGDVPGVFDGGVYYSDGLSCPRGMQLKTAYKNIPLPLPSEVQVSRRKGGHLYCGMLKNEHFGHFLVESLGRLWALNDAPVEPESLVFYRRMPDRPVPIWAQEFLSVLTGGLPLTIVTEPTAFETLLVPDQIAFPSNLYTFGHPAARKLFGRLVKVASKPYKRLYVSRSKLSNEGGFIGERHLEANLSSAGYTIIHPQELSVVDQLGFYNGAEQLIFAEGSALHLFALVARPDQSVYIIQRRKNAAVFSWQLKTFGITPSVGPRPPFSYFIPEKRGRDSLYAKSRIDMNALLEQLTVKAFVSGADWTPLTADRVHEEILEWEARLGQKLVEYPGNTF